MPRPAYPVQRARVALEKWIALRIAKSPDEAPITVNSAVAHLVAQGIATHRATLYSKGLHLIVVEAARKQRTGGSRSAAEQQEFETALNALREQNHLLEQRNRALLSEIATMVYNARRCNVSEDELRRTMPAVDRSISRADTRTRGYRRR